MLRSRDHLEETSQGREQVLVEEGLFEQGQSGCGREENLVV